MIKDQAYGKIILIGEHSVVYGQPAIALPFFGAKIEVSIRASEVGIILDSDPYLGNLNQAPLNLKGLTLLIKKILASLNKIEANLYIKIESSLLIERGMGSSAAVAAATTKALFKYYDQELEVGVLSEFVDYLEKIVHGNPSGIDRAIVVNKKSLYYIKGEPIQSFDIDLDAYLLVADTGDKGNTKVAVSKVKDFISNNPKRGIKIIESLGDLANQAKLSIEARDVKTLGNLMNKSQSLLSELKVSNDRIDNLVNVSLESGALGSKLTGGGLGGCIISLCTSIDHAKKVELALLKSGAKKTWITKLAKENDIYEG